jgi:autotransporter-associated beta strand protein
VGKLTLGAANTYTGNTSINAGTVQFNDPVVNGAAAGTINANFGATVAAGFPITQAFLTRVNFRFVGHRRARGRQRGESQPARRESEQRAARCVGAATLSGTIAPVGTQYRLGGGGGTLTLSADERA